MNWLIMPLLRALGGTIATIVGSSLGKVISGSFLGFLRRRFGIKVEVPLGSAYQAPEPPAGVLESKDLALCDPVLQRRWAACKLSIEARLGVQIFETCTWRSKERQKALYQVGRDLPGKVLTNCDGETSVSRHNVYPAEALDFAIDLDPGPATKVSWEEARFDEVGAIIRDHGLVWGGDFKSFKDRPHVELPADFRTEEGIS